MKRILLFLFIIFNLSAAGQAVFPFANGRSTDTAKTPCWLNVARGVVFPFYASTDSTKVLAIGADGKLYLKTVIAATPSLQQVTNTSDTTSNSIFIGSYARGNYLELDSTTLSLFKGTYEVFRISSGATSGSNRVTTLDWTYSPGPSSGVSTQGLSANPTSGSKNNYLPSGTGDTVALKRDNNLQNTVSTGNYYTSAAGTDTIKGGEIDFVNAAGFGNQVKVSPSLIANKIIYWPSDSGTIALRSDITTAVTTDTTNPFYVRLGSGTGGNSVVSPFDIGPRTAQPFRIFMGSKESDSIGATAQHFWKANTSASSGTSFLQHYNDTSTASGTAMTIASRLLFTDLGTNSGSHLMMDWITRGKNDSATIDTGANAHFHTVNARNIYDTLGGANPNAVLVTPRDTATTTNFGLVNLGRNNIWSAAQIIQISGITTTTAPGLTLYNPTLATSGNPKYSPGIYLLGNGYSTTLGSSQIAGYRISSTTNSSTNVLSNLSFDRTVDGVTFTNFVTIQDISGQARLLVQGGIDAVSIANTSGNSVFNITGTNNNASTPAVSINAAGTITATSGTVLGTVVKSTYNETSGNAANTDLSAIRSGTVSSSGIQRLQNWVVGVTEKSGIDPNGSYLSLGKIIGGSLTDNGVDNGQFTGSINVTTTAKASHFKGNGSIPSIAAGTGAGTSPTVSMGTGSTDVSGYVNVTTGTLPTLGATVVTVTFATAYAVAPKITLTPANSNTAILSGVTMCYVDQATGVTTTTFKITAGTTALTAATAYQFWYSISE